jgi:protein associated with RNAse G/E
MIVDLIDEVDFKERLIEMGAPLNIDHSIEEVQDVLSSWFQDYPEQRPCIMALFKEMQGSNITILPEVSIVMKALS